MKNSIEITIKLVDYAVYDGTDESAQKVIDMLHESYREQCFIGSGRVWIGPMSTYVRTGGGLARTEGGSLLEIFQDEDGSIELF